MIAPSLQARSEGQAPAHFKSPGSQPSHQQLLYSIQVIFALERAHHDLCMSISFKVLYGLC